VDGEPRRERVEEPAEPAGQQDLRNYLGDKRMMRRRVSLRFAKMKLR